MSKRSPVILLCGFSLRLCVFARGAFRDGLLGGYSPRKDAKTQRKTAKKSLALLLLTSTIATFSSSVHSQVAKQTSASEILNNKCLTCHEIDLIRQQRLNRTGWTREVDKMIRWGASISNAEKEPLIDYLTANFPPQAATKSAAGSPNGKAIYEKRCTICHESDIVEGQRLSRTGWTREVEKMVRWGASVDESEKTALIDYLSTLYPVRPLSAK